jgi:hypothetical protein
MICANSCAGAKIFAGRRLQRQGKSSDRVVFVQAQVRFDCYPGTSARVRASRSASLFQNPMDART